MRALALLLASSLFGCQAILGSYDVEVVTADTAGADTTAADTGVADTANPDTAVIDSGVVVTSCREHKAKGSSPTMGAPGSTGRYQLIAPNALYPTGVFAFCEMEGPTGGYTLVATRSSTTNGSVWSSMMEIPPNLPPAAIKPSYDLGPDMNVDAYLNIDWRLLGPTEIVYDLGAPVATMGKGVTRITFKGLSSDQIGKGLQALTRSHPREVRPDCFVDSATTAVPGCIPGGTPPGDPMKSYGWAHAPLGTMCYWAVTDQPGSLACNGTTVGKGRVFVK